MSEMQLYPKGPYDKDTYTDGGTGGSWPHLHNTYQYPAPQSKAPEQIILAGNAHRVMVVSFETLNLRVKKGLTQKWGVYQEFTGVEGQLIHEDESFNVIARSLTKLLEKIGELKGQPVLVFDFGLMDEETKEIMEELCPVCGRRPKSTHGICPECKR